MTEREYDVLARTRRHVEQEPPAEGDRQPAPWESSWHATCECLSWRGSLDNLERRNAEDDLGETFYAGFPNHIKSPLVVAHRLMDLGHFSPQELEARMNQVRERMERT